MLINRIKVINGKPVKNQNSLNMKKARITMFLFFTAVISSYSQESGCISGDCENSNGIYKSESGEKYEGNFKNKKKDGYGTLYWTNGSKYEGKWENDNFNGQGTLYYANGNKKYKGNYKEGKREGKGIFYYEDGYEFMGTWVDNLPYNGILFSASGLMAGKYVDGKLKKN